MDSSAQHRITQLGENLYGGVPHYEEHLSRGAQDVNNGLVASAGFRTILNGREANLPGSGRIYRNSSSERYMQHRRSPIWANYKRCIELELNGKVDIAIPQTSSPKLVVVRRAATTNLDHQMQTLLQLMAQPYFARCFEVFGSVSSPYFVCEYLSLTLGHIMGLPLFPTEVEVVAITGQLVEALAFLERHNLAHEGLSMSNILLNDDGYVKIGWARFLSRSYVIEIKVARIAEEMFKS
ncbi:hypothetical protein LTR96_011182 [Exophiala xenobiotica]|nr:hypothetical protein LTR72_011113 [Exophiala xenobiotica]KAK5263421.1 hypothetical protein LTR96_011182 [Exophiala xenobiotica]KAK5332915.1 hypothetical protein LTR98_010965 [Exophiala xenobiotica]